MPHESDVPKLGPEQIDRAMFILHDEQLFRDLAQDDAEMVVREQEEAEKAAEKAEVDESIATTDKLLKISKELRQERAATEAQRENIDFDAILQKNVSKTKRIPIEKVIEDREVKVQAALEDEQQGHSSLGNALSDQFGGRVPIFHEGKAVDFENPNEHLDQPHEIPKGTPSHHAHHSRTSRSTVLARLGANQKMMADGDESVKTDRELRGDL